MSAPGDGGLAARRVVFSAVRQAGWEDVALPAQLAPHQVLVRTACSLVSAGTEMAIYSGSHIGYTIPGSTYPSMPHRPGYAAAGTVEAVGDSVTAYKVGDRIAGSWNHASHALVDASRALAAPLPDGVAFEQGALARLASIAMQGVRLARVRLGETVAVFGQGLIGQFARQHAQLEGAARTIAVDLFEPRLELARRHGATETVRPASADTPSGVRGADVAIEATGAPAVINDALRSVADFGRVVLLGSPRGRVEIDPYSDIHRGGVSVIGAHARTADLPGSPHPTWTMPAQFALCLELMRQGRLRTDGLVSHRLPAAESLPIFEALRTRPQEHLGVLIEWV
ncbi:MAG TPA: zinc-binding dehydrogenase [Chloroflexota bacterium]|nr:zinc-binding dehydrogenase [Chloroflexota bacterium]